MQEQRQQPCLCFQEPTVSSQSSQSSQSQSTRLAADQRQITYQSLLVSMCFVLRASCLALRSRKYAHGIREIIVQAKQDFDYLDSASVRFFLSLLSGDNLCSWTGIILGMSNLHTAYRGREMLVISCRLLLSIRGKLTVMQTASTAVRCLNPSAMMFCVTGASQMQA